MTIWLRLFIDSLSQLVNNGNEADRDKALQASLEDQDARTYCSSTDVSLQDSFQRTGSSLADHCQRTVLPKNGQTFFRLPDILFIVIANHEVITPSNLKKMDSIDCGDRPRVTLVAYPPKRI